MVEEKITYSKSECYVVMFFRPRSGSFTFLLYVLDVDIELGSGKVDSSLGRFCVLLQLCRRAQDPAGLPANI